MKTTWCRCFLMKISKYCTLDHCRDSTAVQPLVTVNDYRGQQERSVCIAVCACVYATSVCPSHRSSARTEPRPAPGRSRRANLPPMTARTRSWPPAITQRIVLAAAAVWNRDYYRWWLLWFVSHLHVRLSGDVVLEVLHRADQEGNVTGEHLHQEGHERSTLLCRSAGQVAMQTINWLVNR